MVYNQQLIWILMPLIFSLPVTGNIFWAELVARGPFTVKCTVNRFWGNGNMEKRASPYENTGIFCRKNVWCLSVLFIVSVVAKRLLSPAVTDSPLSHRSQDKSKHVCGHWSGCDKKHTPERAPLSCHSPKTVIQHNECFSFFSHACTITVINKVLYIFLMISFYHLILLIFIKTQQMQSIL